MSFDLETLYNLLPAVYRIRDLEQCTSPGECNQPLRTLLSVIVEQIGILEENLAQLYDDQFIETCADWVVPYIGDLVGYRMPHLISTSNLRSDVANTLNYRKRKGTALLMEELLQGVTGWNVHIVEYFQLLAASQHVNRPYAEKHLIDLSQRGVQELTVLETPFEQSVHTVDVRKTSSKYGRYNVANIGVFVWRLTAYSLTGATAAPAFANDTRRRYRFSPLGNDVQLFNLPRSTTPATQLAGPLAVAMPIDRSMLARSLSDYYGPDKSLVLTKGEDYIFPNPKNPSLRLKRLINISNSLCQGLDELSKEHSSRRRLDVSKHRELIEESERLHTGLHNLYKHLVDRQDQDLNTLKELITQSEDLHRRLADLASIRDVARHQLELEQLIPASDTLLNCLNAGDIDPQKLEDLITIADLSDKVKKDADGRPVTGKDAHGATIILKEEDLNGNPLWENMPEDRIAIDPVLGRIAFPINEDAPEPISTFFHYGFSSNVGGGEYSRASSFTSSLPVIEQVPRQHATVSEALDAVCADTEDGVVEITDSRSYEELPAIHAIDKQCIELRAADSCRPLLKLHAPSGIGEMQISGEAQSQVILNGLIISNGILRVTGNLGRLSLRHCTLVPGLSLSEKGEPHHAHRPSLVIDSPHTLVEIDHCIVGALHVKETAQVRITNSIVDATSKQGVAYAAHAGSTNRPTSPGGSLSIENSTIIGRVHTVSLELASNTIFLASPGANKEPPLNVERRQEGCVRYSYVPYGSRIPRCYQCQPPERTQEGKAEDTEPVFTSLRYGNPGYCQLLLHSPVNVRMNIRKGADDQSEMGVFHELHQPQRAANLHLRLREYLPLTIKSGVVYMT